MRITYHLQNPTLNLLNETDQKIMKFEFKEFNVRTEIRKYHYFPNLVSETGHHDAKTLIENDIKLESCKYL